MAGLSQSSFAIGHILVEPALALAPLHEITDQTFRVFMRGMGGLGLTVSEMVSCEALIRKAHKAKKMLAGDGGCPFAVQLVGSRPEAMADAAAIAQESGADIIDINMGCPASNVTGGMAGSALLRDAKLAESCIKSITAAVHVPVTVKMRVGWDERQKELGDYLTFLRMFEDNGIAAVTIHPRTRSQQFTGRADWSCIARAVDLGLACPIIGNGDVLTREDAEQMARETGCSGVMAGRGALHDPLLFVQIMDDAFCASHAKRVEVTIKFFELVMNLHDGKDALHKIKKFTGYFTKGVPGASRLRQRLNDICESTDILEELKSLAESVGGA
jgi:nifR3 family TIM-barrel protein